MIDLTPSITRSWIYWRNILSQPAKPAFNLLAKKIGIEELDYRFKYDLTAEEYFSKVGTCPYCKSNETGGVPLIQEDGQSYYCICAVLEYQDTYRDDHDELRTPVPAAYVDDLIIPKKYTAAEKSALQTAIKITKKFIYNPVKWVVYSGAFGTGKTHLARAINQTFRPMSLYISAKDLESKVHEYRRKDMLDDFWNVIGSAPILILDDIGSEYGGNLVKTVFTNIIDRRYERWPELPTVVVTNLGKDQLKTYLPRAADRLLDREKAVYITLRIPSFRSLEVEERYE